MSRCEAADAPFETLIGELLNESERRLLSGASLRFYTLAVIDPHAASEWDSTPLAQFLSCLDRFSSLLRSHCSRCAADSDAVSGPGSGTSTSLEYPLPLGPLVSAPLNQMARAGGALKTEKRVPLPAAYHNVFIPDVLSEMGICNAARSLARRLMDESAFVCSLEMGCIAQPVALVPPPMYGT